jgi:hypothetical protein
MSSGKGIEQALAPLALSLHRFAAHNRGKVCLLAAVIPVLIRLSLTPYLGIPEPYIHDEFSYLLGAETFAHGRLTNPTHPMWVHFEEFHVNYQPTYATKYPPGPSLLLALGQVVFGHPWYGVLLSLGLMCGCACWMLQGWVPPLYVLLGSAFMIAEFSIRSYWVNSYWGLGALAAAGGALVFGAIPRLVRQARLSTSMMGAIGAAILANTRPFEGLIVFIACSATLLWWRRREKRPLWGWLLRISIPPAVVLGAVFLWMGYYNYRVTGNSFVMPYAINQEMYSASPHFWILPDRPVPDYHHEVFRQMWVDWDRGLYLFARTHPYWPLKITFGFIFEPFSIPLRIALLAGIVFVSSRKVNIAKVVLGALFVGLTMEKSISLHYVAPATGVTLFFVLTGCRSFIHRASRHHRDTRTYVFLTFAALAFFGIAFSSLRYLRDPEVDPLPAQRKEVIYRLMEKGPRHLVFVKYGPNHDVHDGWVHNRAEIDASEIVWAQDMGRTSNQELVDYYPDRQVWILEADLNPPRLKPY